MRTRNLAVLRSVALLGVFFAGGVSLPAQTPSPTGGAGSRPVAVLMCRYSDKPNTYGFTPAGILQTWLNNPTTATGTTVDNSINGLMQEASGGTLNFNGTQAFGWYTLPNPLSYYQAIGDPQDGSPDGAQTAGTDCIAAAQNNGVNLAPFTYVAVYMNDIIVGASGESWSATLPAPSPTEWNALIVGARGLTSPPLVLHEFGHILSNMGWHTTSGSDPLGAAAWYGDNPLTGTPPLRMASVSPGWDASRRELMGLVGNVATFTGGTQTYNLSRLTQPLPGMPSAIDVPLPNGTKYVVSVRTRIGNDALPTFLGSTYSYSLEVEGVRIELFTSTTVDTQIETSAPTQTPWDAATAWMAGQSYVDTANGITITVNSYNPTGNPTAQITISTGLSGNYKLMPQNAPGSCLDVFGAGNTPGTKVDLWGCNGGSNQTFNLVSQGNGIYQLQPANAPGLCLDVFGAGTTPGTNVDVWTCTGGSNQNWNLISDPNNLFELAPQNAPGLRLDVFGAAAANGTAIDVWTATGGTNQKWKLSQ